MHFKKLNKTRFAKKKHKAQIIIYRMVISQMLDSMEYLQSWKLVIFGKRATMKRDDRYLSLPLRITLYSCFVEDDLLLMNTPLWVLNDQVCPEHSHLPFIPNFCVNYPFRVLSLPGLIDIFFYVSNFCLNRPFGFSIHRDALFCLSRSLRVFNLASCSFVYLGEVFLDCVDVHRTGEFFSIHSREY